MGRCLRDQNRDIVFSLCQYGMNDVWKWGDSVGGNSWRTTGDIVDLWDNTDAGWQDSVSGIGFDQNKTAPYARPGNWNDPDMLVVGEVGWGNTHPSRLTPDEQYTHVSMWCLLSAPLLIGCDLEQLDAFTLGLLSNDEVLALDQDALGKQAVRVATIGQVDVFEKELEDGSKALGFFNRGNDVAKINFNKLGYIGLSGTWHVRELWRQTDLPDAKGALKLRIEPHGVVLLKFILTKPQ